MNSNLIPFQSQFLTIYSKIAVVFNRSESDSFYFVRFQKMGAGSFSKCDSSQKSLFSVQVLKYSYANIILKLDIGKAVNQPLSWWLLEWLKGNFALNPKFFNVTFLQIRNTTRTNLNLPLDISAWSVPEFFGSGSKF